MEQAPFYVGQRIVVVHTSGLLTRGSQYNVTSINKGCCNKWMVTIGIKNRFELSSCKLCNTYTDISNCSEIPFGHDNFAPIQDQYEDLTREIAEGLKETKETPDKILIPETVNN